MSTTYQALYPTRRVATRFVLRDSTQLVTPTRMPSYTVLREAGSDVGAKMPFEYDNPPGWHPSVKEKIPRAVFML